MKQIEKAVFEDLPKILNLQKLAFLNEAKLLNNFSIQPLMQTQEELENEFAKSIVLKLEDESKKIIGSVRAYEESDRVWRKSKKCSNICYITLYEKNTRFRLGNQQHWLGVGK